MKTKVCDKCGGRGGIYDGDLNMIEACSKCGGDGLLCCSCEDLQSQLEEAKKGTTELAAEADCAVTMTRIGAVVCKHFGVEPSDILGPRRYRHLTRARMYAMHLSRTLTDCSFPEIAAHFGRTHSTVMHADKRVASKRGDMPLVDKELNRLSAVIRGAGGDYQGGRT